jgi:hypothetical protein
VPTRQRSGLHSTVQASAKPFDALHAHNRGQAFLVNVCPFFQPPEKGTHKVAPGGAAIPDAAMPRVSVQRRWLVEPGECVLLSSMPLVPHSGLPRSRPRNVQPTVL